MKRQADGRSAEPPLGVLDGLVGYHLRRANAVVAADFARCMGPIDMRQVLFGAMSVIARHPGIRQSAVGEFLGIQRANMVALINELIDRGFVRRDADPDDRRAFALALTEAGRAMLADSVARIARHEQRLLEPLSDGERATLIDLLRRVVSQGATIAEEKA